MRMGWFETVQDGIYMALCAAFRIDPDSVEGAARFVPAYLPNATTPQARRDANVCYYAVSEEQGTQSDYTMLSVENSRVTVKKTIPASVLLTFYGPDADSDAESFWSAIQVDTGHGSPRAILRSMRIVLDGWPGRPVSIFETEGTYHRRRCDVRVDLLYLEYQDLGEAGTIVNAPVLTLINNDGHAVRKE